MSQNKFFIWVDKNGFLANPYMKNANIKIEVSEELYNKSSTLPFYHAWKYTNNDIVLVELLDIETLQARRQEECFDIIDNRSPMWYKRLTADQQKELDNWYQAWLDVTETKAIPEKPTWLK